MIQSESVTKWKSAVHEAVKEAIQNSPKKQVDLAKDIGVAQSQVSGLLHRPTSKIRLEALLGYADKLGVPFSLTLCDPRSEVPEITIAEEVEELHGNA